MTRDEWRERIHELDRRLAYADSRMRVSPDYAEAWQEERDRLLRELAEAKAALSAAEG